MLEGAKILDFIQKGLGAIVCTWKTTTTTIGIGGKLLMLDRLF